MITDVIALKVREQNDILNSKNQMLQNSIPCINIIYSIKIQH